MITSIHIENFKSIQSLDLELGRLNVFIGANGSGKSNILEAIAMGSAAMEDKLDDEFLFNRGIRVSEPKMMKSGFDNKGKDKPININWSNSKIGWNIGMVHSEEWLVTGSLNEDVNSQNRYNEILDKISKNEMSVNELSDTKFQVGAMLLNHLGKNNFKFGEDLNLDKFVESTVSMMVEREVLYSSGGKEFLKFLIYAPENHFLRRFEEEAAIKPLGIKGEGLFKLVRFISVIPDEINEIKQHLKLIDWFEDFEIPTDLKFTERRIKIKDQYLADDLQYFDQRSANEGFLYLLFYLTLFVSDLTPHFFAIDNIDNSLNPKLGSELIKVLAKLSKEHNKQALLTTHNPVILDGLDLNDDDQRLFVVYRNADGHTKVRRIPARKPVNGIEPVRLSEAFIRGYIGGIPDNF
jgi:AAA15 family ATPase/GTPase